MGSHLGSPDSGYGVVSFSAPEVVGRPVVVGSFKHVLTWLGLFGITHYYAIVRKNFWVMGGLMGKFHGQ